MDVLLRLENPESTLQPVDKPSFRTATKEMYGYNLQTFWEAVLDDYDRKVHYSRRKVTM